MIGRKPHDSIQKWFEVDGQIDKVCMDEVRKVCLKKIVEECDIFLVVMKVCLYVVW